MWWIGSTILRNYFFASKTLPYPIYIAYFSLKSYYSYFTTSPFILKSLQWWKKGKYDMLTNTLMQKSMGDVGHIGTNRFGRSCQGLHLLMGHPYVAWRLQRAKPKRQNSSSRGGSRGPEGGASSVKEEEQHHCKPIVL